MGEWFRDSEFWRQFKPLMFDSERVSQSEDEVESILRLTGMEGGTLLDLCCGFGRHSIPFAKRGVNVTGIDLNREYLKEAEQTAQKAGVSPLFLCCDASSFCRELAFDGIVNLFTSFGYFDQEKESQIVKNLFNSLKPGGFLFLEMVGKEVLARDFEERFWLERDGLTILVERSIELNWTQLKNRWIFYNSDKRHEYTFSHTIYSAFELAERLSQGGFERVELYGDWDGSPYDHNAKRLIAIGRKGR